MRIEINYETCLSSGQCEYLQAAIFRLDDDDLPQVQIEGELSDAQLTAARSAVEMCPSQSIALTDS